MGCCSGEDNRIQDSQQVGFRKSNRPRHCTDLYCLVLFLLFWAGLIFIASFAFVVGSPFRLIHGQDSFGNTCGKENDPIDLFSPFSGLDMSERPFVFYMDASNISHSLKICVKMCPNETIENEGSLILFHQKTNTSLCRYDVDTTREDFGFNAARVSYASEITIEKLMKEDTNKGFGPCPKFPVYSSKAVLNRCVPLTLHSLGKDVVYSVYAYLNSLDSLKQVVGDIMASGREMGIMVGVAVAISFTAAFLIHHMAAFVSYMILTFVSISLLLVTGVLWWTYVGVKYQLDNYPRVTFLEETIRNEKTFLGLAIISTVITIVLLLLCLVMRKRVKLVVALFQEAGCCIRAMPGILIQPLWTLLVLMLFLTFWLAVLMALATADYPEKANVNLKLHARRPAQQSSVNEFGQADIQALTWISFSDPSWVRYMWWYLVVALFWMCEFILDCQQMVIAGAVASWYFCRDRTNLPCPVGRSIRRLFCFHMGSVALGSFLITLLKLPRYILMALDAKLRNYEEYYLVKCCLKCCACCLWMVEKFVKFLNHNAYTVIAIEGSHFCSATQVAFTTIVNNALRVAAINSVGDFILFLGKIGVTALTAALGTLLFKQNRELEFFAAPVILISIVAYFIAHCVFSVYEMVIDTLFLCFCEDYNKNDGLPGKEYYAPPSLMAFMTESSQNPELAMKPLRRRDRNERPDSSEPTHDDRAI